MFQNICVDGDRHSLLKTRRYHLVELFHLLLLLSGCLNRYQEIYDLILNDL